MEYSRRYFLDNKAEHIIYISEVNPNDTTDVISLNLGKDYDGVVELLWKYSSWEYRLTICGDTTYKAHFKNVTLSERKTWRVEVNYESISVRRNNEVVMVQHISYDEIDCIEDIDDIRILYFKEIPRMGQTTLPALEFLVDEGTKLISEIIVCIVVPARVGAVAA